MAPSAAVAASWRTRPSSTHPTSAAQTPARNSGRVAPTKGYGHDATRTFRHCACAAPTERATTQPLWASAFWTRNALWNHDISAMREIRARQTPCTVVFRQQSINTSIASDTDPASTPTRCDDARPCELTSRAPVTIAVLSPARAALARGGLRCKGSPAAPNPHPPKVERRPIAARLGATAGGAPAALRAARDRSCAPMQRGRARFAVVPGGARSRRVEAASRAWPRDAIRKAPSRGRA